MIACALCLYLHRVERVEVVVVLLCVHAPVESQIFFVVACGIVHVGSVVDERVRLFESLVIYVARRHVVVHVGVRCVCTYLQPGLYLCLGVDTAVVFVLLCALHDTFESAVSEAYIYVAVVAALREAHAVVVLNACLRNLLQPVVCLAAAVACKLLVGEHCVRAHYHVVPVSLLLLSRGVGVVEGISVGKGLGAQLECLLCVHGLGAVAHGREAHPAVVAHCAFALASLLGCNHDNTVGTARTVEGCGRSVLENLDRLNVVDVDRVEESELVVHNQTVYYIYR